LDRIEMLRLALLRLSRFGTIDLTGDVTPVKLAWMC
jgi:hypothetical protein